MEKINKWTSNQICIKMKILLLQVACGFGTITISVIYKLDISMCIWYDGSIYLPHGDDPLNRVWFFKLLVINSECNSSPFSVCCNIFRVFIVLSNKSGCYLLSKHSLQAEIIIHTRTQYSQIYFSS